MQNLLLWYLVCILYEHCMYICFDRNYFFVQGLDEGKYVETDYYSGHVEISNRPLKFVLVTDR